MISSPGHLKDKIYYSDLYDRITVDECRRILETIRNLDLGKHSDKKLSKKDREHVLGWTSHIHVYVVSGERYLKKRETIERWITRDKAKDDRVAGAVPPGGVTCLKCGSPMHLEYKDLHEVDGVEQVWFMFRCEAGCKRGRVFYEDGHERIPNPPSCPKCHHEMETSDHKKGKAVTTTYKCTSCGHAYSDIFDFSDKKEKPDPDFEADRNRFCLDEKRGQEYVGFKSHMDNFKRIMDEIEERKENKEVYDAVAKIRKLPVAEAQKLVAGEAERHGYSNLQFQPPEIGKDVIVPFTAMDGKFDRSEHDSRKALANLISEALAGTNWKLMSDGVSYRVGYVSGRLKCYEREEDLKRLVNPR